MQKGQPKKVWIQKGSPPKTKAPGGSPHLSADDEDAQEAELNLAERVGPEPESGSSYERHFLLQIYQLIRDRDERDGVTAGSEGTLQARAAAEEVPDEQSMVVREVSMTTRPDDEQVDEKAARRALRELKKQEKAAKRAAAGSPPTQPSPSQPGKPAAIKLPRETRTPDVEAKRAQETAMSASAAEFVPGKPSTEVVAAAAAAALERSRAGTEAAKVQDDMSPAGGAERKKIALSLELPASTASSQGATSGSSPASKSRASKQQPVYPQQATSPDLAFAAYLSSMAAMAPMNPMQIYASSPGYTTVMLRNIPNRYTRDMLIARLDAGFKWMFDFVYLPIDFNSKCNVGYAFINFRTPAACERFIEEFHGVKTKQCLPGFSSQKVCEVSYARVQGRDPNMDNLRDEKFIGKLAERPDWQPLFIDDAGHEVPFAKTLGAGKKRTSTAGSTPSSAISPANAMANRKRTGSDARSPKSGQPQFAPGFFPGMMHPAMMYGSPYAHMGASPFAMGSACGAGLGGADPAAAISQLNQAAQQAAAAAAHAAQAAQQVQAYASSGGLNEFVHCM